MKTFLPFGPRVYGKNKKGGGQQQQVNEQERFCLIVIACQVVHQTHSVVDRRSVRSMPTFAFDTFFLFFSFT